MSLYRPQRNYGCRIHDAYTYYGMRTLVLENEKVRISLLLDKGAEVFEYLYKPRDLDFMWLTPNAVQNPNAYLSTSPNPIATFIDYYAGGWQEVFPNAGPTSEYMGAEFGQHGEVAQMPWDCEVLMDSVEQIQVRLQVVTKKVPFRLTKTLTLCTNSTALEVDETVENLSGVELQYMWGQHLAFGKPFAGPGCTIRLPEGISVLTDALDDVAGTARLARRDPQSWPKVEGRDRQLVDLSILPPPDTPSDIAYLVGFGREAWYTLENPDIGVGVKVEWDGRALPYLWYWQEFGGTEGYPWYGRHYNIGLEPFSSYPTQGLARAVAKGSAKAIPAFGKCASHLTFRPYEIFEE